MVVPPLPQKQEAKFTPKSLDKRRYYLERFLKACCKSEVLASSQLLVEFLMIKHNNPKSFQDKLKSEEA